MLWSDGTICLGVATSYFLLQWLITFDTTASKMCSKGKAIACCIGLMMSAISVISNDPMGTGSLVPCVDAMGIKYQVKIW